MAPAAGAEFSDARKDQPEADPFADLPWQPPLAGEKITSGQVDLVGVCYRRDDGGAEPVVEQNQWLEVFARFVAREDVGPVNAGIGLYDRLNRLLFARGGINADVEPVHLKRGQELIARYRLKLDLEPGEYVVSLTAAEPWPDPASPNGWDQDVGGVRYVEMPHASVLAVLPRSDRRKLNYGPAALPSDLLYAVKDREG